LRKHTYVTALLVLALTASQPGCASKEEREPTRGAQAKPTVAPDGSIRLMPEWAQANGIQTAAVIEQDLTATVTAIGRVRARAGGAAQVFSPFAGRLIADPARVPRVGSFVKKGQVVAEVEQLLPASERTQFGAQAAQLQTEIVQAQQEVGWRRTELERAKQLYEGGAIPLRQLQTAEFNLEQAQAKLEGTRRAKAQYDAIISQQNPGPRRAPILAPISGTVVATDFTAGEQIEPSKSLLTIIDLASVWVEVAVHESQLQSVRRAERAEITTPASPGRTYAGTLINVGNIVDPENRTVKVTYAVTNSDGSFKIGLSAEARILTGPSAKALLVPASAVLHEENQEAVYVESEPGVFRRRVITTGERSGEQVVASSGLQAGERVVSVGAASLRSEARTGQMPSEVGGDKR